MKSSKPPFCAAVRSQSTLSAGGSIYLAGQRGDPHRARPQLGQLVVGQDEQPLGAAEEGRDVRGEQRRAVGQPEHERACCDGPPLGASGSSARDDGDRRTSPARTAQDRPRPPRPAPSPAAMCSSIRWASTSVSVADVRVWPNATRRAGELGVVLDDPVLDDRHRARCSRTAGGRSRPRGGRGWPSGCGRRRCVARSGPHGRGQLPQGGHRTGAVGGPDPPQLAPGREHHARPSRTRGTRGGPGRRPAGRTTSSRPVAPMMPHMAPRLPGPPAGVPVDEPGAARGDLAPVPSEPSTASQRRCNRLAGGLVLG